MLLSRFRVGRDVIQFAELAREGDVSGIIKIRVSESQYAILHRPSLSAEVHAGVATVGLLWL